MAQSLGQKMMRTAGLFQGLVALPVMFVMGEAVFVQLFYSYYYVRVYDFILAFFNALMSAAVIFIIFIQRQPIQSRTIRLYFEIVKSSCATAVWLWLLFDSIFGPWASRGYPYNPPRPPRPREPRIIMSTLSVAVLFFLYYPTLAYAILDKSNEDHPENPETGRSNEQTPLLRE